MTTDATRPGVDTDSDTLRVVICDDDAARVREWCDRIEAVTGGRIRPTALEPELFGEAVGALKERKAAAKQSGGASLTDDAAAVFDGTDLLILDSDLTPDRNTAQAGPAVAQHLVGELGSEVAHLARCFSSVGPIMVVNQRWRHREFDLTMMETALEAADVYVSEEDVDNLGLWYPEEAPKGEFRPWH